MSGDIYRAIEAGSGFFQHGHTYVGHPAACAAGLAVVRKLTGSEVPQTGLVAQVPAKGRALRTMLAQALGDHPNVGDIRGRGLFIGMEFVANRETKEPLDPALQFHAQLKKNAFEHGLICYPMGGTADGARGDHVLLAPPFICTPAHFEELTEKLRAAVETTIEALGVKS